ncbi:MAG: hypothetical protein HY508_08445 [Acidobacteria bacterium]|nr:hypothetical protein [Acidobacteriota bacterium]
MINWRSSLVWTLLVSVSFLPISDCALWAKPGAAAPLTMTRDSVWLLGEGADVKIQLTDGQKLKGEIKSYGEEGLVLDAKGEKAAQTVKYNDIAELKPAKKSYKASGVPDPVKARAAVVGLGVGQHIKVKFDGDRVLHGHITAIGPDRFTIMPDKQQAPVEVAYNSMQLVHENPGAGATLVLLLVVAGAIAIAAVALTGSDTVRGSF